MKNNKILKISIISIFVLLYFLVATISMINSVDFFSLSHSINLSWSLAIGFEIGAAASLAAIIILDKTNRNMVWGLFITLTLFQMMANSYHAFSNLENYKDWIQLFGLETYDPLFQKRILSIISGAFLPLVALGFIKSLTDYIRPYNKPKDKTPEPIQRLRERENEDSNTKKPKKSKIINKDSDIKNETKKLKKEKQQEQKPNLKTDNTVKAKSQGKTPSSNDFQRTDGMPLKGS